MSESSILRSCMITASQLGARLFRNNVGLFQTKDGRTIRTGLCVGSSDLIGWKPVVVTPAMVGKTVAVFFAVECKTETGRATPEQVQFLEAVRNAGGIATLARSEKDIRNVML